ncbi:MAG: imidazole glycerol phosphate synthase subunit HisH [Ignisphaera sp.]|uniref:Imidazole glycerol phosphate synthase subunit HisH n=1 Tax=Ignisphaera aggregans TaxID=334771 RepID=A0A7C4NPL0_9CREN
MKALVLNYGVGNIFSIVSALRKTGFDVDIANDINSHYNLIVLPGVGSFKALKPFVEQKSETIKTIVENGVAVLGICLGMQALFEYSTEYGFSKGIGVLRGYVDRISTKNKVPHIGWSKVYYIDKNSSCEVFKELDGKYVYFAHSYVVYPKDIDYLCMISLYDMLYPAAIAYNNIFGTQFHPEKSSSVGLRFIKALAEWLKK